MKDEKSILSFDEAVKLLPEGENIHTFRNSGGMLFGADWDRETLLTAMKEASEIEETGPMAQAMGHGLAIVNRGSFLYIETKRATP